MTVAHCSSPKSCSLRFQRRSAHTFIGLFFPCDLELTGFRDDGPHFNSLTELETGAAFGYLHGLFKTVRLNDEETCNCFLGFCKRAVLHYVPVRENFTVM